jgi:hypothetical protein
MIVAFCYAFNGKQTAHHARLAEVFIKTIRRFNNDIELVQMGDDKTPVLEGVDSVVRRPNKEFGQWYFESMIEFPAEQFLRIETDTVLKGDCSEVFAHDFDIACGKEHKGAMNNGVVFVKNKDFFVENLKVYKERTSVNGWNDIQVSTQMTIDDGKFRVRKLDPKIYNCIPDRRPGYLPETKIVHYKDVRKAWMIDEFGA